MLNKSGLLTRTNRRLRIALLILCGTFISFFIFPFCADGRRRALKARWSSILLATMGIEVQGDLARVVPGAMLVANHISWVDVFVINALLPSAFVAKAEVRRWPMLGWLAMKNDTVFMRRGSCSHARMTNEQIAKILEQGKHLTVFPEGTTSDGCCVLPFYGALLQPALTAKRPVVPVAISYWEPDGQRSQAPRYDGDISFGECLTAIIGRKRTVVKLAVMPALGMNGEDRRQVADEAREAIACAAGLPLTNQEAETVAYFPDKKAQSDGLRAA